MKHDTALPIAQLLIADLAAGCRRIEVAGSVRRGRPEVHDIEVVAVPAVSMTAQTDMFGDLVAEIRADLLAERFQLLQHSAGWDWCLDTELPRNGPRYKRLRHKRAGICADVFITEERGWGGAMAIRTGPAEFSQALVTLARRQGKHVADGYLIHGHPKPRRRLSAADDREEEYPCPKGNSCPLIIPSLEEADFFAALGLPHWDPAARTAELLWKKAAEMEMVG